MDYYELQPEDNIFTTVSVPVTYQCQKSCNNCYLGNMLNNPDVPVVDESLLSEVLPRLPRRVDVRFLGAEPTMHPNFFEYIRIARKTGHRPSLLTNGLKLRREDYVVGLKEAGLNMLGLSMNGGLEDEMYLEFDNGKYAKSKMLALEHCFKHNILVHMNVIIDPTNVHVVKPLAEYAMQLAVKYGKTIGPKFPVMMRLKSIGKLGTFRDTYTYSLKEMMDLFPADYGDVIDGHDEGRSVMGEWNGMYIKLTDWTLDEEGVVDAGSKRRGILTERGTLAPCFEYYTKEEQAYRNRPEEVVSDSQNQLELFPQSFLRHY